jgi:hypothetical protein
MNVAKLEYLEDCELTRVVIEYPRFWILNDIFGPKVITYEGFDYYWLYKDFRGHWQRVFDHDLIDFLAAQELKVTQ